MGTIEKFIYLCPHKIYMVYHEIRKVNGKKQNYLVFNKRDKDTGKWIKKSKFIGNGEITKKEINRLKNQFEIELKLKQKYNYLTKNQVKKIEELKNTFNKKIKALDKEEYVEFEKSFFTELTYNSNAIEGNTLTLDETSLILNENLLPEGKTLREVYEARNLKRALIYLKNYKGEISELLILRLHRIFLQDISNKFAGRYRDNPVRIFGSNVKFPDAHLIPQLIKNLIYWYNDNKKKLHAFELAIIFSMKLVTIHPFIDGNGRISRLVMNYILQKNNYPWINVYNKQRAKYLKAVRKANDEDYSLILELLINNLEENLKDFNII